MSVKNGNKQPAVPGGEARSDPVPRPGGLRAVRIAR